MTTRRPDATGLGWDAVSLAIGPLPASYVPERRDYASFADFADPDGNTWILQETGYDGPASARGLPG
jgi:hypothetical protein